MGDRFGVVDLTFAALSTPLLTPDEHPIRHTCRWSSRWR